ncbi:mCG19142 [Mus musculus]|nr:mCG19142 [Mus musculus]
MRHHEIRAVCSLYCSKQNGIQYITTKS